MSNTTEIQIPQGFRMNGKGDLVHESNIKPVQLLEDELVLKMALQAEELNGKLAQFKCTGLSEIEALIENVGLNYNVKIGGKKGNVQLLTFDGKYKLSRTVSDRITFSTEILVAKELIDRCLRKWAQGANKHLIAIAEKAFKTNSKNELKVSAVMDLFSYDIDDPEWLLALDAVRDAIKVVGSTTYMLVHKRDDDTGEYHALSLNLASV